MLWVYFKKIKTKGWETIMRDAVGRNRETCKGIVDTGRG